MKRRKPSTVGRSGERNKLGARGETLAADFLLRNGYEILERNWQGWWGEVDILARKGETVYVIEVKTLTGEPATTKDSFAQKRRKQRARLQAAAAEYPEAFVEGKLLVLRL